MELKIYTTAAIVALCKFKRRVKKVSNFQNLWEKVSIDELLKELCPNFFLSQLPADEVKTATEVVVEETVVPSESTKEESPAVKEPKEETSREITSQQGKAFCSMYDC